MSKLILKTAEEVELIRESSLLVSRTLAEVGRLVKPGVKTIDLNKYAETFIRDNKGIPAFLNYSGFPYSLCISTNDRVVHGFPGDDELKEGDIISIDCGTILNKFYGDSAFTFAVGEIASEIQQLLDVTRESLLRGIEKAVVGSRIGDIGFAIQDYTESHGYGVVKELVGHGVGFKLHEKPEVPNYGKRGTGMKLEEGMVIAIEPMINLGRAGVKFWKDGWTVSTVDGKPSAHFEHTVAIRKGKADILSTFDYVDEVLKTSI
ncbi:Methionine aminopeptidase [Arcticibacter svalbardensis MN12-7]|uniref:Methionine aminopeptidase n=1 Tax=Arcticibacter svalbardensis MN12-7 TaxID=1150600 RepID=R9GWA3_9SPHI|nr:type I methionyl aminopeptidase [Arcticibacter svalbardensis]EOR93189.1 Methionine aminopeptidase [Arcticibacter svalbardensis MN12-7]